MAQVVKKFQSGGKPKPIIIKIDGKDRNYDDIERDVWGNFDAYAQQQGWNNDTQQAVRQYLDYALPGLKAGTLTYGHNIMNGVSEDWQSDGTFNTSGKGIFKKDITTDKKAGATLGTAYLNKLFADIIPEYKAPELKNIGNQITQDIAQKIIDNNFGGNQAAFNEGWARLSPQDRYTIFKSALADLSYDESEYKDVATFNTNRGLLLQALGDRYDETNGLNQSILDAYNKLGGYGLELFIKGEPKQGNTSETIDAPTIEDMEKQWRQEAIEQGYHTEQAIADYIASKKLQYDKIQEAPGQNFKYMQDMDQFSKAGQSLDNYIKNSKGLLYKNYSFNRTPVQIDNAKLKAGDSYNFSNFSESNFRQYIKKLSQQFRSGKLNAYMWRGVLSRLMQHKEAFQSLLYKYKNSEGGVYIIPGSEDMDSESVIVFNPNSGLSIRSIHDFPELFAKKFNQKFRQLYKQQYQFDLPEDWSQQLAEAIYNAKQQDQQQIQQNKNGGILKAQDGAAFMNAMVSSNPGFDLENNYWNQVHQQDAQKQSLEIDEANKLGVTVEELRKQKADQAKKQAKIDAAVKRGQSTTESFTDYDIAGLVGMAGDIASTIGSLTGGAANPVTWGGGLTSLGAYTYADIRDPRVSKLGVAGNFLGNTLLSAAGLIPEIGSAATIARLTKRALTYGPALYVLAKDVPAMKEPVSKLLSGKDLTNDDWMAIANGIRAISTGTRVGNHAKNTYKYTTKGDTKYQVKTNEKGWQQEISKSEYDKLSGKKESELSGILSEERMKEIGTLDLRRNLLTPWKNESRKVQTRKVKSPRRLKTYEEVQNEYGKVSKAYTNMVRDTQAFSNLGVTLRNNRFTKWLGNIGYKSNVTPQEFYNRTGKWGGSTKEGVPRILDPKSPEIRTQVRTQVENGLTRMHDIELQAQLQSVLDRMRKPGLPDQARLMKRPTLIDMKKGQNTRASNLLKGDRSELKAYVGKNGKITLVVDKNLPAIYDRNKLISIDTPVVVEGGEKMTIADAFTKGKQIKYDPDMLKHGGTIFLNNVLIKYQQGGNIVGNVSSNNSSWHDLIFNPYFQDLYEGLKNGILNIDDINSMQTQHQKLWAEYEPEKGAYVGKDNVVKEYQNNIINKYGFVNDKGINNGWANQRYTPVQNRSYFTDYDRNKKYSADNIFGGQTDDRRILGRYGDFTPEQLANYNNKLKELGLEMYLDDTNDGDSKSAYYKLRKLQNPTDINSNNTGSNNQSTNQQSPNNKTIVDSVTGEILQEQPDGTFKAIGNNNAQTKSQIGKVGDDIWKYMQNINPADAIALGRALWGENVNNRVADITKKMGVALLDPEHQTAILHGNYNSKMLAEQLAGKINAAASKPISSDAGTQQAGKLEAAIKATEALRQGNLEDSEMYWKTLQILNQVNNENAANEVATGNENRSRVTAAANNRLQVEAARLAANFEQIWNPYFSGIEQNMRNEDTLRRQAEIDSWKYSVTDKYQKISDEVMERYRIAHQQAMENWKNSHIVVNSDGTKSINWDGFDEYWTTDANGSRKYQKELQDISRAMHKELYEGLSGYYGSEPFILKRAPETTQVWRTPGINGGLQHYTVSNKSGGTLSAADRQALKTTNEINKNIRAANRETFSNIRQDKREHRKAMALVSQLSADLIKKAIGIK